MRNEQMLADWVKDYIFRPVAIAQGFKRTNEWGEEEYIVPDIEFEFMKLKDDAQQKSLLKELVKLGFVSKQTFYNYLGLNYEREKKLVSKEKQEEANMALQGVTPKKPKPKPEMGGGGGGGGMPDSMPPSPGAEMPAAEIAPGGGPGGEAPGGLPEIA
jgi:hypothetical protein